MIEQYLKSTISTPFEWGKVDCATWAASCVEFCTGFDPAANLRGTYKTAFGCRRILIKGGGLLRVVSGQMERFGPLSGDGIAVIDAGGQVLCSVVHQGRAVTKTKDGLFFLKDYKLLKGWSW